MQIVRDTDTLPKHSTVAAIGLFDGVQLGHLTLIDEVKRIAAQRHLKSAVITFAQHPQAVLRPDSDIKMLMTVRDKVAEIGRHGIDVTVLLNFTYELSLNNSRQFLQLLRDRYGVAVLVVGYDHRFEFFEKDPIPAWEKNEYFDFYKWLIGMRHANPALASGDKGGKFEVVSTDDSTLVFTRTLPENKVTVKAQLKAPWSYEIIAE